MRHLIDMIAESLAEPYDYEWDEQSSNSWHAKFEAMAGEEYFISISKTDGFAHPDYPDENGDWFDLAFGITRDGFAGKINTDGDAFRVFSTAIAAFRECLLKLRPELIMLSADKDDENRFPLYSRMAKRFDQELRAMGYQPYPAPAHRYAPTSKYFDSLAWRIP